MKRLLNYVAKSKKLVLTAGVIFTLAVVLFSCIHLRAVYYPEVVETNSTFEVKLVADMNNPLDGGITERFGYGFVGVLLPVGWTIDTTSVEYDYRGKDNTFDNEHVTGSMLFNQEMTDYCITLDNEQWGDEFYWQGFRTDNRLHSENMDSIVITFNVTTNNQVGDYMMLVGIQESSYDKDGTTKIPGDPGNTLMDNKPDGPFYKTGDPSSDEFSKEYLSIKVEQGTGTNNVEYSKKDKENYTVASLGNGKLMVSLLNESKIGATCIVYDINGRQVASQQLSEMKSVLDVKLQQGTCFVALEKDGIRSSKKVLVK